MARSPEQIHADSELLGKTERALLHLGEAFYYVTVGRFDEARCELFWADMVSEETRFSWPNRVTLRNAVLEADMQPGLFKETG